MGCPRIRLAFMLAVLFAAACSAPATLGPTASGFATFDEGGIAFQYPAGWQVWRYQVVSSSTSVIAYFSSSSVAVPEPCATTIASDSTRVDCEDRFTLQPDTLVLQVSKAAFPGFDITALPADATALPIGGLPGYVETEGPDAAVPGVDRTVTWSLAQPGFVDNYYTVRAQMRGPGLAGLQASVDGLIASLRYDPPVAPLATGPGAGSAAAAAALATLTSGDPAWACFPSSGSRQALITSLPNGPDLDVPQLATCSTSVVATPLQMWRLDLSISLPTADPAAGQGGTLTVWITPDGPAVTVPAGSPNP